MNPSWSIQTRYFVLALLLVLTGAFLFVIRELIGPLVVAALLAYVLNPVVNALIRRLRIGRRLAVVLTYVLFIIVLVIIPAGVTPVVFEQVDSVDVEFEGLQRGVEEFLARIEALGFSFSGEELPIDLGSYFSEMLMPDQIFGVLQSATENLVWLVVIFLTAYYILADWEQIREWVYGMVPEPYKEDAQRLYTNLREVWQRYLRGQLLSMTLIGLLAGIASAAIGLPGAAIFGLLAGVLGMIPSVGSSVMAGIAPVVALFTGSTYLGLSNFWFAVLVAGVYIAIHLLENYWLRPRILGQGLQLHPGLVIVGIIGALTLGGVVIALIIAPIIRSVEIVGRYTLRRIMGVAPWPEEGA